MQSLASPERRKQKKQLPMSASVCAGDPIGVQPYLLIVKLDMEKDMAKVDYSEFQLEAVKNIKEAHYLLVERDQQQALEKLDLALANLRLMRTAVKYHA